MKPRTAILFLFLVAWLSVGVYNIGLKHGKEAEREDTRSYVNQSMADMGFCKWLKVSRMAEDCADRESRVLNGGEAND